MSLDSTLWERETEVWQASHAALRRLHDFRNFIRALADAHNNFSRAVMTASRLEIADDPLASTGNHMGTCDEMICRARQRIGESVVPFHTAAVGLVHLSERLSTELTELAAEHAKIAAKAKRARKPFDEATKAYKKEWEQCELAHARDSGQIKTKDMFKLLGVPPMQVAQQALRAAADVANREQNLWFTKTLPQIYHELETFHHVVASSSLSHTISLTSLLSPLPPSLSHSLTDLHHLTRLNTHSLPPSLPPSPPPHHLSPFTTSLPSSSQGPPPLPPQYSPLPPPPSSLPICPKISSTTTTTTGGRGGVSVYVAVREERVLLSHVGSYYIPLTPGHRIKLLACNSNSPSPSPFNALASSLLLVNDVAEDLGVSVEEAQRLLSSSTTHHTPVMMGNHVCHCPLSALVPMPPFTQSTQSAQSTQSTTTNLAEATAQSSSPANGSVVGEFRVFGVRVGDLLEYDRQRFGDREIRVPLALHLMMDGIVENGGLTTHGIFRECGSALEVQRVRGELDAGADLLATQDVFVLSSALKLWLRLVPDGGLLPQQILTAVATSHTQEKGFADALFKKLEQEDAAKADSLRYVVTRLCSFLSAHSSGDAISNPVNEDYLGVVLGPSLTVAPESTVADLTTPASAGAARKISLAQADALNVEANQKRIVRMFRDVSAQLLQAAKQKQQPVNMALINSVAKWAPKWELSGWTNQSIGAVDTAGNANNRKQSRVPHSNGQNNTSSNTESNTATGYVDWDGETSSMGEPAPTVWWETPLEDNQAFETDSQGQRVASHQGVVLEDLLESDGE